MKKLLLTALCLLTTMSFAIAGDLPICPPPAHGNGPSMDMQSSHKQQPPQDQPGQEMSKTGTLPDGSPCVHPKPPHEGQGGMQHPGTAPSHEKSSTN